jgi:hypothetical protein
VVVSKFFAVFAFVWTRFVLFVLVVHERRDVVLQVVKPGVFPDTVLGAEEHLASWDTTVVVVLVQQLAARVARVVGRVPARHN